MVCDLSYLEDWEEKALGLTESISNESVYRTAPATPGLLQNLDDHMGPTMFFPITKKNIAKSSW